MFLNSSTSTFMQRPLQCAQRPKVSFFPHLRFSSAFSSWISLSLLAKRRLIGYRFCGIFWSLLHRKCKEMDEPDLRVQTPVTRPSCKVAISACLWNGFISASSAESMSTAGQVHFISRWGAQTGSVSQLFSLAAHLLIYICNVSDFLYLNIKKMFAFCAPSISFSQT